MAARRYLVPLVVDTANGDINIGEAGFAGFQIYSTSFPSVASVIVEASSGGVGYLALRNANSSVDQIMMQAMDSAGGAYAQFLNDSGGTLFLIDGNSGVAAKIFFGEAVRLDSQTSDPASPSDGDLFYRSDLDRARLRANGAWVSLATTADVPAAFTAEDARDTIGTALVAGVNVSVTVSDPSDTITIASNPTAGSDPGSPVEGQEYTNTSTHRKRYYDGDEWIQIQKMTYGAAGGEPASPANGDVYIVV